jgi:hypothetical protein
MAKKNPDSEYCPGFLIWFRARIREYPRIHGYSDSLWQAYSGLMILHQGDKAECEALHHLKYSALH